MTGSHRHDVSDLWDDLVDGGPVTGRILDPSLAGTIRRLHRLPDAPAPDESYAARLRQELVGSPAVPRSHERAPGSSPDARATVIPWPRPAEAVHPPDRASTRRSENVRFPIPARYRRWAVSHLSLAALLVMMLGGVWITLSQNGNGNGYGNSPASIVVELTGPIPSAPAGAVVSLRRVTLEAGVFYTDIVNGPTVILVERGSFAFASLKDGTDRSLRAGDTATATAMSTFTVRNESATTGSFLLAMAYPSDDDLIGPYFNEGMRIDVLAGTTLGTGLPVATLSLGQVTIAPGEALDPWQTTGRSWISIAQGSAGLTLTGDRVPGRFASGVERVLSSTTSWLGEQLSVEIRNAAETTLILVIMTVEPVAEATPP